MIRIRIILFVLSVSFFAAVARGQVATGTPPFGSFSGGPFDVVNNGNLNVHLSIPVESKAGRGLPFNYNLSYDSSVWYPVTSGSTKSWQPVNDWGWNNWSQALTGYMNYTENQNFCTFWTGYNWQTEPYETVLSDFTYYDKMGAPHFFPGEDDIWSNIGYGCPSGTSSYDVGAKATDGSGYIWDGQNWDLTPPSGTKFSPPYQAVTGAGSVSDSNGNTISNTAAGVFTDTLGVQALTVQSGSGTTTFTYPGSGGSATVTVHYVSKTVRTNFGCSNITDFGPTSENLVSEIDLPDGEKYTFTYETTPGYSSDVTGRLASVKLPSGGTIDYGYSGGSNGITCADGSTATLTRTTPDGIWTYAHSESGTAWTTTLKDPNSNTTTYYFQSVTPSGSTTAQTYETERQLPGSAETIYTCYNGASKPCNSTAISLPITQRTVWTVLGSDTSEVHTQFDTSGYGLPTEVDAYDWGPTLSRKTLTSYDYNNSCGVPSGSSIISRPCSVTIENSSGGTVSSTSYDYDSHGNLLSKSSGGLTEYFTYNSNGTMATSKDVAGNTTTFGYGSNSCSAFPDSVTPPKSSLKTTAVWNCNGAVKTSSTDANGNSTDFTYDNMNRLTATSFPNGGSVTADYAGLTSNPPYVQTTTKITSGVSRTDTIYFDGLGRVSSKTAGGVTTNTSYDNMGRLYTTSVSSSGQQDTYSYDALSRVIKVAHADSSYAQVSYSNNCATTTDESNKVREVCKDGLGRTSEVIEDPSGLDYTTTYSYDPLNDLTGVTQGSESRSFTYDSLGRLTQAVTPESGTVNYTYDSDATCASSAGDLVKRVDARSIRTCYAYDSMHRLTSKTYSDSTPAADYYYDQTSYNGLTISNGLGEMTGMNDGSGKTAWSYDSMGRAVTEEKTISSITKTLDYSYNYDGSVASVTYPSGRVIAYGVDSLGRPQSAEDQANSIDYATSATYAAQGALASVVAGKTGTFNGITYSVGYNNRLLPSSISASSSNGTALSLSYSYYANGDADVITNNITSGRTATYGYDALNRINSASSQASSGSDCWGDSYGYDRYGNLTTATVTQCTGTALSLSVNGNNRITNSGFTFNASGDELSDGLYSYAWDAEGRMTSGASVTYTYDGEGERVKDSGGTLYWRGAGGAVLAETDTSGNTLNEYIFFAGMRMARRDSSGNVYYYFGNSLGSATITSSSGTVCYDADFYPFGGELAFTNTCSQSYKFAGMHRDSATGLDHTEYRQYSSNLGRWLSPDPSGMAAVSLANPQSLNMYAYVTNNPTNLIDALGLDGGAIYVPAIPATCNAPGQYQTICENDTSGTYVDAMAAAANSNTGCMSGEYGCQSTSDFLDNGSSEGNDVFDTMANVATPEQRMVSIDYTGYDPILGVNWDDPSTYLADAQGQFNRLNGNLAQFNGLGHAYASTCNLIGGHCNFGFGCDNWKFCGPGRYNDGIHVECASGGYACTSGPLVVHDDTVSPWEGLGSPSFGTVFDALFTVNFWEHAFVDYAGGSLFVGAFPQ